MNRGRGIRALPRLEARKYPQTGAVRTLAGCIGTGNFKTRISELARAYQGRCEAYLRMPSIGDNQCEEAPTKRPPHHLKPIQRRAGRRPDATPIRTMKPHRRHKMGHLGCNQSSDRRCGQLRQAVATKLKRNWSPEQIAGWLKWKHPEDGARRVSHETIYRSLYVQARGVQAR